MTRSEVVAARQALESFRSNFEFLKKKQAVGLDQYDPQFALDKALLKQAIDDFVAVIRQAEELQRELASWLRPSD